jgi:hypothetical protein
LSAVNFIRYRLGAFENELLNIWMKENAPKRKFKQLRNKALHNLYFLHVIDRGINEGG